MTRARENLTIISTKEWSNLPNFVKKIEFKLTTTQEDSKLIIITDLGDIVLSFNSYIDDIKKEELIAGKEVRFEFRKGRRAEIFYENKSIALASKKLDMKLKKLYRKGYHFKSATVEYFVYWYDKENDTEVIRPIFRIVLSKQSV